MPIRELEESDLPAVLDLCQRSLPHDQLSLELLRRRLLAEPNRTPAYQLCLWDGAQLAGVMFGGMRRLDDGHTLLHHARPVGVLQLFAVDPALRRRGLALELLAELERRMRAQGLSWLRCGNFAPSYFWPGLDVRYTPALCLLLLHGFHRKGDALNMTVDLHARDWDTTAEEARLAESGYRFRRAEPGDLPALAEWVGRQWGPIWQWELGSALANQPPTAFVARQGGQFCAFAAYGASSFPHVFTPTGTAEQHRWRGLGRVLLFRCLADLRARGLAQAEIGWVGPISFYARNAGATISRVFFWLEKEL